MRFLELTRPLCLLCCCSGGSSREHQDEKQSKPTDEVYCRSRNYEEYDTHLLSWQAWIGRRKSFAVCVFVRQGPDPLTWNRTRTKEGGVRLRVRA